MDWKDDFALATTAESLGENVIKMYDSCGIPIPDIYLDPKGPPVPNVTQKVIEMFILDAKDYMSLDPQKIIDEYQRMQKAADATGTEDSQAAVDLQYAHTLVAANWHGEAAKAFADQMTKITMFMDQQQERLAYAMQAMGTVFGIAVQFRRSYFDMAHDMINACYAVMAKRPEVPTVSSTMIAIGKDLVKLGTGAFGAKNPKELVKVGIDWFKDRLDAAQKESVSIDSGGAAQVLGSYLKARDRLRASYEEGLNELRNWLDAQRSAYFSLKVPILEPMPACTDVRRPDFSYGNFFNDGHDPGSYSPRVEQERKKFADENPRPEGPIHRRLKGEV